MTSGKGTAALVRVTCDEENGKLGLTQRNGRKTLTYSSGLLRTGGIAGGRRGQGTPIYTYGSFTTAPVSVQLIQSKMVNLLVVALTVGAAVAQSEATERDGGNLGLRAPPFTGGSSSGARDRGIFGFTFNPAEAPSRFPGFGAPSRPACRAGFSVRKASSRSLRAITRVRFQEVLLSLGGWSPSYSDFQAPCTGIYYFAFHAISPQFGDFTMALMKNGRYEVTAYGSSDNYQQASNSALLYLRTGDLVHLELQQGTLYEHPANEAYTTFSGFLVREL